MTKKPPFAALDLVDSVSSLPPAKRYITTHNEAGKSVIHSCPPQQYRGHKKFGGVARSYSAATFPVELSNDADVHAYVANEGVASYTGTDIVSPQGVNVNVIDLAPLSSSQFHRTLSVDVVTCTHGHLQMQLDNGEMIDLYPGDHVVQRSTMHKWTNPSETEPARMVAMIVPAVGFEIADGKGGKKEIREEHVAGSEEKGWDVSKL